jgi:hypothetical protein
MSDASREFADKSLDSVVEHSRVLLTLMGMDPDQYFTDEFRKGICALFNVPPWMRSVELVRQLSVSEEKALLYDFVVGKAFTDYVDKQADMLNLGYNDYLVPLVGKQLGFVGNMLMVAFHHELHHMPAIRANKRAIRLVYQDDKVFLCTVNVAEVEREVKETQRSGTDNLFVPRKGRKSEAPEFDLSRWFPDISSVTVH